MECNFGLSECNRVRLKGTLSGEETLPFSFLPPFSIKVNSERKDFAPPGEIPVTLLHSECTQNGQNSMDFWPF